MNQGYTGVEIAEMIEMPPALDERGTPTATTARSATTSRRSTSATSAGSTATRPTCGGTHRRRAPTATSSAWAASTRWSPRRARTSSDGDLRFAAQLLRPRGVRRRPDHAGAKELLASTYEQLGYGAENGTWRNFFLTGAKELRDGAAAVAPGDICRRLRRGARRSSSSSTPSPSASTARGPGTSTLAIDWVFTDLGRTTADHAVQRRAVADRRPAADAVDLTVTLTKPQLFDVLLSGEPDGVDLDGDPAVSLACTGARPTALVRHRHALTRSGVTPLTGAPGRGCQPSRCRRRVRRSSLAADGRRRAWSESTVGAVSGSDTDIASPPSCAPGPTL